MIRILASIPDKGGVISGGEENFHFLKNPDLLWGPPSLLFSAHQLVFFAGKAAGSKEDHSPPSNDEGRNGVIPQVTHTPS
jgi:hypothetical protein